MSIKVPCRNPTFGGFIIGAGARRIGLTFSSPCVHRRAICQRAQCVKKRSQTEARIVAFQIILPNKRRPGLCNVLPSLFYSSVIVAARLNGRGRGAVKSQQGRIKRTKGAQRKPEMLGLCGLFSVTAALLPLQPG